MSMITMCHTFEAQVEPPLTEGRSILRIFWGSVWLAKNSKNTKRFQTSEMSTQLMVKTGISIPNDQLFFLMFSRC